ncbi:CBS domain-containing protein [Halolamina salifodinae]|uniref:Putative transcriptional regulator/ribosome-associated translation inhibitor RaiA n=3 Tax=Halolamina salifodinae TaxID=1202767 RepID=A0A8T4H1X1_9EURY|nr:CBS domain-containing protein [Halolamina salifodinae]MBP1987605.1 putative transcriptional regulator/ribosome-associated translation inhibitor RaiA [Halolamina salifodinae]
MDISDIAVEEFAEVDADTRVAKVRSLFERENLKGIVVMENGDCIGVLREKQLIQSHVEDDTKVSAIVRSSRSGGSPPKVGRHDDVREVCRVLVEGDVKVAPVYEGENLWGIVAADDILRAVHENLEAITVGDIATTSVVTITEDDHVGKAINRLREHGISRIPVVNESAELTGILTTNDIVEFAVRDEERQGSKDRRGEIDRMLDIPVYDLMSSPVNTITPGETVEDAVSVMFDNGISGLVVTATPDGADVAGVITKTDVLRALSLTEQESMNVQITNINLLDDLTREALVEDVTQVVDKFQEMNVLHAHVRFTQHKEKLRGTPLIRCQIRLRTTQGQVAGSGEGYGADHAFHVALDRLERNVLELKGVKADEEYRGQLLRKLNEL